DAVDLVFAELVEHEAIESHRRVEAGAEWLFDYHADPRPLLIGVSPPGEAAGAEVLECRLEHARRDRQIEETVPIGLGPPRLDLLQALVDVRVRVVFREIAAGVERPLA